MDEKLFHDALAAILKMVTDIKERLELEDDIDDTPEYDKALAAQRERDKLAKRETIKEIKSEYVPEHKRDIERTLNGELIRFELTTATIEPSRYVRPQTLCERGKVWAGRKERKRSGK